MDQTIHLNQYKIITYQINVSILIFLLKLDLHFVRIRILPKLITFELHKLKKNIPRNQGCFILFNWCKNNILRISFIYF